MQCLYMWDATISLVITPSLPGMKSLSVGGGASVGHRRVRDREMLPTLVVGRQTLALRSEEAGCFHELAGMSIVVPGSPCSWYTLQW